MAHKCGFIAAESVTSAEWHKKIISSFESEGKKFRAWSRGEHPTLFQVRVYLPTKYNIIPSIDSTQILINYNPYLKTGTFELLREEGVKDGRALFYSVSRDAFLKLRETYKLNFPLGKVDCNNATPKNLNVVPPHPNNPIPTPFQIPPPPEINQNQLNQTIQSLASTPPTPIPLRASTPLPSIPQNKIGNMASLPSPTKSPTSSPPRPTYSPVSCVETSDTETSGDDTPKNVSKREALLETSGTSSSSKGSHKSRPHDKRSESKRKRDKGASSSGSTNRHRDKKRL